MGKEQKLKWEQEKDFEVYLYKRKIEGICQIDYSFFKGSWNHLTKVCKLKPEWNYERITKKAYTFCIIYTN